MPGIATILVTYNPDLAAFAQVLQRHADTGAARYVIVDNASAQANEIEALARQLLPEGRLSVLRQPSNIGLGAALNLGTDHARAAGCSHVVLFDQDSLPSSNTLASLLEALQGLQSQGLKVGVVGPSQTDVRTGAEYPQRLVRGHTMATIWPSREPGTAIEVSFLITSGSLIDISTLDAVGPMRADFFIDYIDIEWCFRAASQGFRSYCIKTAHIQHALGDQRRVFLGREVSVHSAVRQYYMFRNVLALSRLRTVPLRFRVVETLYFMSRAPAFFWLSGCSAKHLRHMLLGIAHGLTGRMGPLQR